MTRLLVSVRSAAEARLAQLGGADLIDVKEPNLGSLGAAAPEVWSEVAAAIGRTCPLSAALGELVDFVQVPFTAALQGYSFAKLGLAGCERNLDWAERWQAALAQLPAWITPVAVAYADYRSCGSPPPGEVLRVGLGLGCGAILVDTFDKQRGNLFDAMTLADMHELFVLAESQSVTTVLAGSLRKERLDDALGLQPHYIAVRGAVCRGTREGELDSALVREWASSIGRITPALRT